MQFLAPIALFVYNRPEHTRRTIAFLKHNLLADESRLFIFSDAAASEKETEAVENTRHLIQDLEGFKSIQIIEQKTHQGLANSIIKGVTQLVKEYRKVIVFEDDLLSSPYTLTYFNDALQRYAQAEKVMQVGGYMFPMDSSGLPQTFFSRTGSSWGWATWDRAWDKFEEDVELLYSKFDKEAIERFSYNGTMNYWKQLLDFRQGKNDSWAIRWNASIFLNAGLVLYPAQSLIDNIGHDGTGVHSIIEDTYKVSIYKKPITQFPDEVAEHPEASAALIRFFKKRKGSWVRRGKKFIRNVWHRYFRK